MLQFGFFGDGVVWGDDEVEPGGAATNGFFFIFLHLLDGIEGFVFVCGDIKLGTGNCSC